MHQHNSYKFHFLTKTMASKTMVYKDDNGDKYKISYSEELQLKQLRNNKKLLQWQQVNFYVTFLLLLVGLGLLVVIVFVMYRLDAVNFFTNVAYR